MPSEEGFVISVVNDGVFFFHFCLTLFLGLCILYYLPEGRFNFHFKNAQTATHKKEIAVYTSC